jgi:hypothetical protein
MVTVEIPDAARDRGPTVRRMILGGQLRRLRERAEITCVQAGDYIRNSASKISRLETGRLSFKERDVADLLTLYGVLDEAEREQFLVLARNSRQPDWWHRYSEQLPKWLEDYLGLEQAATLIKTFELQYVPGLLQTEDYARGIATRGRMQSAQGDVEGALALRMRRQQVLSGPHAPQLWAVIDESVLYRPMGGEKALRGQVERLLELSGQPNISLQVLPYAASGYAAEGAFTLLRFAEQELPDVVYVEHLTGALYLERLEDIEVYSRALDRLAVDALTPLASRQLMMRVRSDL